VKLPYIFSPIACLMYIGTILEMFVETLKKHVILRIMKVIRSTNTLKLLNKAITVKIHCRAIIKKNPSLNKV